MIAAIYYFHLSSLEPLPPVLRVGLYGLLIGVVAMLIFWRLAPQARLNALKLEMAEARKAVSVYNGTDPREILRLSGRSIHLAMKQLLLVLLPTLAATAPVIAVMAWIEHEYTQQFLSFGPAWMRTWEIPFMIGLSIAALAMKFAIKII